MNILQALRASVALMSVYASYLIWALRTHPEDSRGCVEANDISIFFRRFGDGEPVLLLHGGFASWENWAGQIPALAKRYRVIAMDSRGHGRTTLGTRPITYRQMAEDVAALIEQLDLGRVHLAGWSDGGCTSIALALERPDLVRSMVLLGTPYNTNNYSEEALRQIESFLRPGSLALLGLRLLRRLVTPEPGLWKLFLQRMTEMWIELPDFTVEELRRIEAPTLVVACDKDEFLSLTEDPLQVFKETAEAIPNARMVFIPGGTHSVQLEKARALNSLVIEFLESVRL